MDFNITAALKVIQISRAGVISVYCLSLYEWLETLPAEIELIYPSRWNSIKAAYLLCRYYQLAFWPFVIFAYGLDHTAEVCANWTQSIAALQLPMQLVAPAVMLMRAYAFTGRSVQVLVLLLVFYAALVGISVWFFCFNTVPIPHVVYEKLGGTGCFPDYGVLDGGSRIMTAMSAALVMDFVSLSVIAIYCLRARSTRGSLGRIFISQGLGAFAVVLIVHGTALGAYFGSQIFPNGAGLPYILVISNLMACRIILALRRKALPTETEMLRQHSRMVDKAFEGTDLWVMEEEHPSIHDHSP